MVLAGLAGSPQMISATLLALTRIMYEFKGNDLEVLERKGFIYESCCEKPGLIKYEQQRAIQPAYPGSLISIFRYITVIIIIV